MTTTIRVGAPRDLLALIPALAGYRPERSLVCLAFTGSRAVGVLRYDLPSTPADRGPLAEAAVSVLCRIPGVDGVAAIVYSDHRYRSRAAVGERALLRGLLRRVRDAGFSAVELLRVAADAWGSLLDEAASPDGRSLAEIAASPLGGHAAVRAAASLEAAACATLPEVGDAEREAVRAAVARHAGRPGDPVAVIESLLADPPADPLFEPSADAPACGPAPADVARLADLTCNADIPVCRDAMMLQIAFGPDVGALALGHGLATARAAARAGTTVTDYVERMHRGTSSPTNGDEGDGGTGTGHPCAPDSHAADSHAPASDAPEPDPGRTDRAALGVALSRVLMGETEERPDPHRVEEGLRVLKRAAASATGRPRAALLCMCGWLAWGLGRGSAAWAFLEAALRADSEHGMSRLLSRVFASGTLPEWAFHPPADGRRR